MAIWQFGISLVPKAGILREHGRIPQELDQYKPRTEDLNFDEDREFLNYWLGIEVSKSVKILIAEKLPKLKSWSSDAEMYGYDHGTKVEVWLDDINCFVDVRGDGTEFLEFFVSIAKSLDCLIVLKESGKVIDSSYPLLLNELNASVARKFVSNPRKTLKEI